MTNIRKYKDFKLVLNGYKATSGSFRVSLSGDEWGEIEAKSKLKFDDIKISLGRVERGKLLIEPLIELGKYLTKSLLPGNLLEKFSAAVKACKNDEGIRLRLAINDVGLQQIPWEFCYLRLGEGDDGQTHFLAINPKVSIVRHPPMAEPVPPLEVSDPGKLRLLAALALPQDQDDLDLDLEKTVLTDALTDLKVGDVQIELLPFVEDTTLGDLQSALTQKPEMFHFGGHGEFGETDDTGSLILLDNKDDRNSAPLPAPELGTMLAAGEVRLAYLGACLTSRVQGETPWASIANRVISSGVPAVLAMQYEVEDTAATEFCKSFYSVLAMGLTVDEAVWAGRMAVLAISGTSGIQWGIPTLYLRAQDGVLFKQVTEAESPAADSFKLEVNQIIDAIEDGSKVLGLKMVGGVVSASVTQKVKKITGGSSLTALTVDLTQPRGGKKKP